MKNISKLLHCKFLLVLTIYLFAPGLKAQQLKYPDPVLTKLTLIADLDCEINITSDNQPSITLILREAETKTVELRKGSYKVNAFRDEVKKVYDLELHSEMDKVLAIELYKEFKSFEARLKSNPEVNDMQIKEIQYKTLIRKADEFIAWGDTGNAIKKLKEAKELGLHQLEIDKKIASIGGKMEVKKGSMTDSDGNTYKTIKIGGQVWMAENLRFKIGGAYQPESLPKGDYGLLYTWKAAKNACPDGWHLPTKEDWTTLEQYINGAPGPQLKNDKGWSNSGLATDNSLEWNAMPAGWLDTEYGVHSNLGEYAGFWSATQSGYKAYYFGLHYKSNNLIKDQENKNYGLSVRCVKD